MRVVVAAGAARQSGAGGQAGRGVALVGPRKACHAEVVGRGRCNCKDSVTACSSLANACQAMNIGRRDEHTIRTTSLGGAAKRV
jgi:hypothetical protein